MKQVTIVGCGLIGSSFALGLKHSKLCERILGWDTSASALEDALRLGVIDDVDDAFPAGDVSTSDLIYLAMPILQIVRFIRERLSQTKPGAIITDAGSTKRVICHAATEHLPDDRYFIGGHPISGSQLSGVRSGRADLFKAATYVLTPDNSAPQGEAFKLVSATIEALGARVEIMAANDHDRVVAWVSHLPQLLSSALAKTVSEQSDAVALIAMAGPGYRDTTRLAGSSWSMWRDVLATNRAEVTAALEALLESLSSARDALYGFAPQSDSDLNALRRLF